MISWFPDLRLVSVQDLALIVRVGEFRKEEATERRWAVGTACPWCLKRTSIPFIHAKKCSGPVLGEHISTSNLPLFNELIIDEFG